MINFEEYEAQAVLNARLAAVRKANEEDSWQEQSNFPRVDWIAEVNAKDTQLGYWEWVEHKLEETRP